MTHVTRQELNFLKACRGNFVIVKFNFAGRDRQINGELLSVNRKMIVIHDLSIQSHVFPGRFTFSFDSRTTAIKEIIFQ